MERRVWNQQPSRRARQQEQKPSEVAARKKIGQSARTQSGVFPTLGGVVSAQPVKLFSQEIKLCSSSFPAPSPNALLVGEWVSLPQACPP